jgi:hypothetical protein
MNRITKPVVALGLAGAVALAMATPSEARSGRNAAAIGAGVAGFAVGAAIGSAAASNRYYGPYGYGPYGYYDGYAYAPGPVYSGPTYYYGGDPSSYYAPYTSNWGYRWENSRERQLRGTDY